MYCTALYCTVLYCTVLHCTVLCCTVLYCTVLYCTVLYCTLPLLFSFRTGVLMEPRSSPLVFVIFSNITINLYFSITVPTTFLQFSPLFIAQCRSNVLPPVPCLIRSILPQLQLLKLCTSTLLLQSHLYIYHNIQLPATTVTTSILLRGTYHFSSSEHKISL